MSKKAAKPPSEVTVEEWLAELEKATKADSDGMTASEIAEKVGHPVEWVRDRILKPAQRQGRLAVGRATRQSIAGNTAAVPVYRIKPKAK